MSVCLSVCQQYFQQYYWIINNIASNIAEFTAILLTILLISNIAGNIAGNIVSNIADSAILLAILSTILLIIQQYCWQYCQQYCQQYWTRSYLHRWGSPLLFSKNWNYPPKIQILTNVKTSPPQVNIKIYDDVFVRIQKCILKGVFGFVSIRFVVICKYILAIILSFWWAFLTPLNASELKNKVTF